MKDTPILLPRETNKVVEINGEQHEYLPEVVNEVLINLMFAWEKLGRPKSVFSESGQKLMEVIISTWYDLYPAESREWLAARAEYQKEEQTIKEQVKTHSGRSLASIPSYIHHIMKKFFTEDKDQNREYYIKLVKLFPILRMANRI